MISLNVFLGSGFLLNGSFMEAMVDLFGGYLWLCLCSEFDFCQDLCLCFVPSYESLYYTSLRTRVIVVWAKWMEYRWPVDVVFSSKKTFEVVGLAEAALS